MDCRELDSLMFPYLDGELVDGDRVRVEAHLAECESCRKRTDQEHAMLLFVRSRAKAQSMPAPEALRARLVDGLHHEERSRQLRTLGKLTAAAAGLALCSVAAHHSYRSFQRQRFVEDAASRHARAFPLEVQKPSAEQVAEWFDGKVDQRVHVPAFPNAVLQGARLINVRDHQGVLVRFVAAGTHTMSLFEYGDKAGDVEADATPEVGNSNGYNVVTWRNGDLVYHLVTDLDEEDIRQMLPPRDTPQLPVAPALLTQPGVQVQPAAFKH
jgi:mycothiol system anti-sigma-R factor